MTDYGFIWSPTKEAMLNRQMHISFPRTIQAGWWWLLLFLSHIFTFCDNWCRRCALVPHKSCVWIFGLWSISSNPKSYAVSRSYLAQDSYQSRLFICGVKRILVLFGSYKQQDEKKNCKEAHSTNLCGMTSTLHLRTDILWRKVFPLSNDFKG